MKAADFKPGMPVTWVDHNRDKPLAGVVLEVSEVYGLARVTSRATESGAVRTFLFMDGEDRPPSAGRFHLELVP